MSRCVFWENLGPELARMLRIGIPLFAVAVGVGIVSGGSGKLAQGLLVACGTLLSVVAAEWGYRAWRRLAVERAEMGERFLQSQKLAALGELAAGIAHEINNPLAIIGQEAELLQCSVQDGDLRFAELDDCLSEILRQVERCGKITSGMLDIARNRQAVPQFTDVNQVVQDVVSLASREADRCGIDIVTTCAPNLPGIYSDPPLIKQVVLNLLNNAVQAIRFTMDGPAGTDHGTALDDRAGGSIFVATGRWNDREHSGVCIGVRDTGPGMSREVCDKIFNPFYTTKPPGKGTGLGLSISLRIVEQLGGSIDVRSEPGHGAEFLVKLPDRGKEAMHDGQT
jgi:signal transduction histidine kinase